MKYPKFLLVHLLLCIPAVSQKQQAKPVGTSCVDSPLLAELGQATGAAVLGSYGYSLREPWSCTRIESLWAGGSTLLHFQRVTAQSDDATAFSVLKVLGINHIWVVPTETGMLEVSHAESDPHNIAAFNALLASLQKSPSAPSEWNEIGKLYMALLGHPEAILIANQSDGDGSCNSEGDCEVLFSDRQVRPGQPFVKWTLLFSRASKEKHVLLDEAKKETVAGR
jgi:hypothetical protein